MIKIKYITFYREKIILLFLWTPIIEFFLPTNFFHFFGHNVNFLIPSIDYHILDQNLVPPGTEKLQIFHALPHANLTLPRHWAFLNILDIFDFIVAF